MTAHPTITAHQRATPEAIAAVASAILDLELGENEKTEVRLTLFDIIPPALRVGQELDTAAARRIAEALAYEAIIAYEVHRTPETRP